MKINPVSYYDIFYKGKRFIRHSEHNWSIMDWSTMYNDELPVEYAGFETKDLEAEFQKIMSDSQENNYV